MKIRISKILFVYFCVSSWLIKFVLSTLVLFSFCYAYAAPPFVVSSLGLSNVERSNPNILIIGIDDLRPELGCYGATHIHSPNIDQLAAQGTLFERAYCQYAVCGPHAPACLRAFVPIRRTPTTTKPISVTNYQTPYRFLNSSKTRDTKPMALGKSCTTRTVIRNHGQNRSIIS